VTKADIQPVEVCQRNAARREGLSAGDFPGLIVMRILANENFPLEPEALHGNVA
jgi:hypothetical protein